MFSTNWLANFRHLINQKSRRPAAPEKRRDARQRISIEQLEVRLLLSAGQLDPTFGNVGRVVTSFSDQTYSYNQANAEALQSDGKIVVAGNALESGGLARYNADGSLDQSFGVGGRITTSLLEQVTGVAVLPNGDILATGPSFQSSFSHLEFGVVQFLPDGSVDTTHFGQNGLATADFNGFSSTPYALTVQSDGKIVVAGTGESTSGNNDFAVARFNSTGNLDFTFNNTGRELVDFGSSNDVARDVKIDANNNILLAGWAATGTQGDLNFALARLNPGGMLDNTFGNQGKVTTDFGQNRDDAAYSVVIETGGFIVAGGYATLQKGANTDTDFALARYNSSGQLQNGFGTNGLVTTDFNQGQSYSNDQISQLALQSDGKIVAVGRAFEVGTSSYYNPTQSLAIARYDGVTGAIDTSLNANTGGRLYTSFYGFTQTAGNAVVIQASGDWVVAGYTGTLSSSLDQNFAVARFFGGSSQITTSPTASLNATSVTTPGTGTYAFTISYSDNVAVNVATLGNGNVTVTGPNSFIQTAAFVSVDTNSNGTPRTATYQITVPNGTGWTTTDNGTYTVTMNANQVQDIGGNAVTAGTLGTFSVGIGTGGAERMYRLYDPNNGDHLYTTVSTEVTSAKASGYTDETPGNPGWGVYPTQLPGTLPVHRVFLATLGLHYYTLNDTERDNLVNGGWVSQGDVGYLYPPTTTSPPAGTTQVYHLYIQTTINGTLEGDHFFTSNQSEYNTLVGLGWARQTSLGFGPAFAASTAPTTIVTAADVSQPGGATYSFTVQYSDTRGINVGTLNNGNITVTGPNGFSQNAAFVSVDTNSNGTPRTATYQITVPNGSGWTTTDNGTYTVTMKANQVQDIGGNAVAAGAISSFSVGIGTGGAERMYRLYDPSNGDHLYTTQSTEVASSTASGYTDETPGNPGWGVYPTQLPGTLPVHRVFLATLGLHYYTLNDTERNNLVNAGWASQGDVGFLYPPTTTSPPAGATQIYHLYVQVTIAGKPEGDHFFTSAQGEYNTLVSLGWAGQTSLGFGQAFAASSSTAVLASQTRADVSAGASPNPLAGLTSGTAAPLGSTNLTPSAVPAVVISPSAANPANATGSTGDNAPENNPMLPSTASQNAAWARPEPGAATAAPLDAFWLNLGQSLLQGTAFEATP